ncbi:MAG: DUF4159 domain-containing protein [Limisphaerales bacterium]
MMAKGKRWLASILFLLLFPLSSNTQPSAPQNLFTIARLKYGGGGDWYWGPSAVPNLLAYFRQNTGIPTAADEARVSIADDNFFSYPFLYMTGHGNVRFTDEEARRLRTFLTKGGFLLANDSYGLDKSFRREMKKVFPEEELVAVPFSHPVYHCFYDFPGGLPKVHQHDGKPPKGYGLFYKNRLVVFYAYEADIGDGWEDPAVYNDPAEKREAALKIGANVVIYALTGGRKIEGKAK